MKIPKTPIAFDYDLWTTEDGKCMVRVKRTGEVSEVDRKVMRILRAEEKRIRRSYGSDNTSEDEDGAEKISDTVLSLDAMAARRKVTASATSVCSSIAFSTIIRSCLTVSGLSLRMTVIPARIFTVLSSRR